MQALFDTLRTDVLVASRAVVDSTWGKNRGKTGYASDPFDRLYCIEGGGAAVTHHDRRFELRPGGLHVIPANTVVRLECTRTATISYLHFKATLIGEMDLFSFLQCPLNLQPTNFKRIVTRMDEMIHACKSEYPGRLFEIRGYLLQLLSPFLAAGSTHEQIHRRDTILRFSPALQYIDANLHRRITLRDLAGLLHLEPTYFSHHFTHTFGLPPMRYVLRRRVERAQQILWNSDEMLEAVAQELGFTDAFHFSKTFKRITGLSPSDFRARKGQTGP